MKKILITGGNGYIAKSIKNSFSSIYNITTISREDFDLRDTTKTKKWFEDKYYDIVIHTAIKGGNRLKQEDNTVLEDNIKMFNNLSQFSDRYNKFINLGSGAEFIEPLSFYGMSKQIIDYSISNKENFFNLRIYAVFDENEFERRFIKSNINRYLNFEPMIIHQNKLMDFIYMEDFISIMDKYISIDNLPKKINCVYQQKYSLLDIANIINGLDNHKVPITIEDNINNKNYIGDYYDLNIDYIGLEQGILNTYRKIKNEKNMVRS